MPSYPEFESLPTEEALGLIALPSTYVVRTQNMGCAHTPYPLLSVWQLADGRRLTAWVHEKDGAPEYRIRAAK